MKKIKELFNSLLEEKDVKKHLNKLKNYHKETHKHSLRVGLLCVYMGYKNSLPKKEIKLLGYSGLFHDLGKLDIPKWIFHKSSPLTEREREIINKHPRYGFLRLNGFKHDEIRKIIVAHHEFQSEPYPRKQGRGIKNKKLREFAKILAIVDAYDALANKRAYKKPLEKKKIKEILNKEFEDEVVYIKQVLSTRNKLEIK